MRAQFIKKTNRYIIQHQDQNLSISENLSNGCAYTLYYSSDLGKEDEEFLYRIHKETDEEVLNSHCQWFVQDRYSTP